MSDITYENMARDPEFVRLAGARDRAGLRLFLITMALFAALLLTVAFAPQLLARPVSAGGVTTLGWPAGAAVIILPWLLTLVYVRIANRDAARMAAVMTRVAQ